MAGRLVGLVGRARAGKDTVAAELRRVAGWQRLAFADELRKAVEHVDPYIDAGGSRLSLALDAFGGWEGVKSSPWGGEVRKVLQRVGVAMREVDPDVWVRPALHGAEALRHGAGCDVVITDVRFQNEAAAIRAAGGTIVWVARPGLPDDPHVSETEQRNIAADWTVFNDHDLEHLRAEARNLDSIL